MRLIGADTRERILAAAKTEFSERGLAGARINRIAVEARASKERLYAYFPSKEALFAAVIERLVVDVSGETAQARGDMGIYVGWLFDNYARHPENARLHDWLKFGMADLAAESAPVLAFRAKLNDIRSAQAAGSIDPRWDPAQLLSMLIEIAKAMAAPKDPTRQLLQAGQRRESLASRRAAAVEAARKLSSPTSRTLDDWRVPDATPSGTPSAG